MSKLDATGTATSNSNNATLDKGTAPKPRTDVYPAITPDALASSMQGRVVLVTGASRGIGRAIAFAFARAGASGIALLARTEPNLTAVATEIASAYPQTKTLVCAVDVTDRAALIETLRKIETELGKVDVLVANAGITSFRPFAYTPGEDWWKVLEVNLKGPMLLAELVLPAMRAKNEGAILFMASSGGLVTLPGVSSYNVSKTALIRACACLQAELDIEAGGQSGIHMYSLHPGSVKTGLAVDSVHPDIEKMQPGYIERLGKFYETFPHTPELCAQLCVYLAAGRGSALRGRYIDAGDDIEDLVRQADKIQKLKLYDLQANILGGHQSDGFADF